MSKLSYENTDFILKVKADRARALGSQLLWSIGIALIGSIALQNTRWFGSITTLLILLICTWFIAEGFEAFWRKRMPVIFGEMKGKVAQVYGVLVIGFGIVFGLIVLFGTLVDVIIW